MTAGQHGIRVPVASVWGSAGRGRLTVGAWVAVLAGLAGVAAVGRLAGADGIMGGRPFEDLQGH